MRPPRLLLTLIAALGVACGGRPAEVTPAAVVPCSLPGVGSADAGWRQVRATGFTFCIPASWPPRGKAHDSTDQRRWASEDGWLTWGFGPPPFEITTGYTVVGVVVQGTATMSAVAPLPGPANSRDSRGCSRKNTPVTLEDSAVMITQMLCGGTWTIAAWRPTPAIYVQGVAHDIRDAERLLIVMQTIRFSPARR